MKAIVWSNDVSWGRGGGQGQQLSVRCDVQGRLFKLRLVVVSAMVECHVLKYFAHMMH